MADPGASRRVGVTVYSDYICPFCYIGHLRLQKLRAERGIAVDWRFLEIHPDNPSGGRPLSELGYPPEHWAQLMAALDRMAAEEGVALAERSFTTNSHRALLLAEYARQQADPRAFEVLNRRLYEAYFLEQRNLGDERELRQLAGEAGLAAADVARAWSDAAYEQVLRDNLRSAARLGITGTPTYLIGERMLAGAVPTETLRAALAAAREQRRS